MNLDIISNISKISSKAWNNLNINNHPFTSYDFLYALEESKSVCAETGWLPQHIILKDIDNKIIGILPNYLKSHSYGEYVFDHSWANAYQKAGGSYYPKLISAIPFTPVKGPRFLYKEGKKDRFELPASAVTKKLIRALESKSPNACYYVTTSTYLAAFLKRALPTKFMDRILAKA